MGEPVVELQSVYRAFKGVVALEDVSFAVQAGTVTVLLGPNGAGKTTAARVITGSLRCDGGSVMTFGVDPTGPHGVDVRRRCGVVAANPALYDRLTGRDNLVYAARLYRLGSRAPIESERGALWDRRRPRPARRRLFDRHEDASRPRSRRAARSRAAAAR